MAAGHYGAWREVMQIKDNGLSNPLIVLTSDEVLAWLRSKADEAGYADREISAVQVTVTQAFDYGHLTHLECPSLAVMVSNIKRKVEK